MSGYRRYHIPTKPAPHPAPHPPRFRVRVNRSALARLLLSELLHYRFNLPVVLSRPCVYGVFSGPVGGFAPREHLCVGCLRCTIQYPEVVQIEPNPDRLRLGDSYFTSDKVDTVLYEAATGRVPVRGAGYRGPFAGDGWDAMWTDMSEIVRPTRDGIHGREFISTSVDLGDRPAFLTLDEHGQPRGEVPVDLSIPVPFLFDPLPESAAGEVHYRALLKAAERLETFALVPLAWAGRLGVLSPALGLLVTSEELEGWPDGSFTPHLVEVEGDEKAYFRARERWPQAVVYLRTDFDVDVVALARRGIRLLHLAADYHGQTGNGFIRDRILAAHEALVQVGLREQVSLIGSGGIVAAEHVPKAIICGLDAVALDTPVLVAWQASFEGECRGRKTAQVHLPEFDEAWGAQRLVNLVASWRDQLLEVLGAMGMREVRRLRGELGRAMFHQGLEREAFAGIEGYPG